MLHFTDTMRKAEQDRLEKLFACAIYGTALPLSMAENALWKAFFKEIRPAWRIPSRYKLSTSLLHDEHMNISCQVSALLKDAHALTLLCDGWTCQGGDSHINFLVATTRPIFVASVHPKEERHTASYIFEQCSAVIEGQIVRRG